MASIYQPCESRAFLLGIKLGAVPAAPFMLHPGMAAILENNRPEDLKACDKQEARFCELKYTQYSGAITEYLTDFHS